jgi:hypothetical protein
MIREFQPRSFAPARNWEGIGAGYIARTESPFELLSRVVMVSVVGVPATS